jgi:hypothetical protein
MSTHRKIEYALWLIGATGFLYAIYLILHPIEENILWGFPVLYLLAGAIFIETSFAKLHVFHLMSGKIANRIVLASSGAGLVLSVHYLQSMFVLFGINVLLFCLALWLHRDFVKNTK